MPTHTRSARVAEPLAAAWPACRPDDAYGEELRQVLRDRDRVPQLVLAAGGPASATSTLCACRSRESWRAVAVVVSWVVVLGAGSVPVRR